MALYYTLLKINHEHYETVNVINLTYYLILVNPGEQHAPNQYLPEHQIKITSEHYKTINVIHLTYFYF